MGATSVRRNIFHHHLSRRPVSAAPSNASVQLTGSAANHGVSGLSSHMLSSAASESTSSLSSGPVDNGEIVTRDKNGGYKLDIPVLPPIAGQEGEDEMEGVEGGGMSGGPGARGTDPTAQAGMSEREKKKIEATLVEMMCRSRNRQLSSEPAEILTLIHQSLRNKVAALDEDNWMYEPESDAGL
ncbi:hypothetical protein P170DRAFT_475807 [Aspergillus steynii IBT 23096]|uniref:Uncharacterized protein n=1 Tax=Aspergillus steynii IBT 23096 TaxID=1392250 RepID=A0A2I2G9F7_9EURO|nr:uncharacterized protein P170DRAFT_475807 [Aspergillus steynii IBT 23096]PLB49517.1 hypothetical protein P170DRAFT_475807 [Aspergillus steynii IBT 23096]